MGESKKAKVTTLAPVGAADNVRALAAFDHRHHGFNLSALALTIYRYAVETSLEARIKCEHNSFCCLGFPSNFEMAIRWFAVAPQSLDIRSKVEMPLVGVIVQVGAGWRRRDGFIARWYQWKFINRGWL